MMLNTNNFCHCNAFINTSPNIKCFSPFFKEKNVRKMDSKIDIEFCKICNSSCHMIEHKRPPEDGKTDGHGDNNITP